MEILYPSAAGGRVRFYISDSIIHDPQLLHPLLYIRTGDPILKIISKPSYSGKNVSILSNSLELMIHNKYRRIEEKSRDKHNISSVRLCSSGIA
jgi:hypothetical protein